MKDIYNCTLNTINCVLVFVIISSIIYLIVTNI